MNIGIFAHVDAGKTTVTENLLYEAGAIKSLGKVDTGNTVTDQMALEKKRGISIQSTPVSFDFNDIKINLIDTPGHVEFIAEVERAMSILDGAILVISAKEGVQSHTILLYESLRKLQIPIILFVNKIDRMGVDLDLVNQSIIKDLTPDIIRLQNVDLHHPLSVNETYSSHNIYEDLANLSDLILEGYINEDCLDDTIKMETLKSLTLSGECLPICYGSALKSIGIKDMLKIISELIPSHYPKMDGPLEGVVFKIRRNEHNKREIYIRLYKGRIVSRGLIGDEKISFIKSMKNGSLQYVKEAYGGDIAVIMGPTNLKVGDVIGNPDDYQAISLGTPTLKTRIFADDKLRLSEVLNVMSEADPFLTYELDSHSKEIYLNLFGEIQMEVINDLMKEKYHLPVRFDEPEVIYKEMPIESGEYALYMYTKEHPFRATVGLRVDPIEKGVEFSSQVTTGYLPRNFQNGIFDGINRSLMEGLKGYEVTNLKVTLIEGEFNSVDSTPADFRNLSPMVFMEALNIAKTKLLWPVNRFKIRVNRDHYGRVMSDLLLMKASEIESYDDQEKFTIKGLIPVETSLTYEKDFISITSGLGMYSSVFYEYSEAPRDLVKIRKRNNIDPLDRGKYLLYKLKTS